MGDALTEIVLAFDEGPSIGLGHRRRIEALAEALRRGGADTVLLTANPPIEGRCVVVDSYVHRADDRDAVRGGWVAAVDDIARDLAVDLVVDPSPGADVGVHRSATTVLAGATYALVGLGLPDELGPVDDEVRSVLVTLGASRHASRAPAIAETIARALPGTNVRVVVGPWSDATPPTGVEPVVTAGGLGAFLADADLVVTAGGVTMLEALALGRPTVAVVIADNQRRAAEAAHRSGAVRLVSLDDAATAAIALAGDPVARAQLSTAAVALVDGKGPDRVAREILGRCS